jgi:hypothetical protein
MPQTPLGVAIRNPSKPRFIRIVCRHARWRPGSQTYEFPGRVMLRYSGLGRWRDLYHESPVHGYRPSVSGTWQRAGKYQYKCPRCRCDLQMRELSMLVLIDAFDAVERQRAGRSAARVQRLDISIAEHVLASFRQAGRSA